MEARLPREKLCRYKDLISEIMHRKNITLRELQSVIGCLNHCCYTIPSGRAFLRRLIDLTVGVELPHNHIRFNKAVRSGLKVWHTFLCEFNGRAMFPDCVWINADTLHLYTDSAKSLGFGAIYHNQWIWGEWPLSWTQYDITLLELYPIVIATHVWGQHFSNRRIVFHTDNQALMHILNKLSAKHKLIMVLVRHLVQLCLRFNIQFRSEHIPGVDNDLADSLSRFHFQRFHRLAPHARLNPEHIPQHLLPENWLLD